MDALTHAAEMADTIGRTQFWTIQHEASGSYIVSDPVAQCAAAKGRYMVTDSKAIELARKVGVQCDDEGRIG
jgi:hypothetical protein